MAELRGEAAEQTEVGQVAAKLLDTFEAMDLPANIDDARLVVLIDTKGSDDRQGQGVFAGSEGYTTDPETFTEMIENVFRHARVMLGELGVDMEVMDTDELRKRLAEGSQN